MGLASSAYALAPWFASAICVLLCGGCGIVTISLRKNQYVEMAIRHRDAQAEFRRGDVRKAA